MRLRPRLTLTTLAVSIPMVLGLVFWDARSKQRAAEEELIEFTRSLAASPGWLARCEANPASWRGNRPGPPYQHPAPPPPPHDRPPGSPPGRLRPVPHSRPATFLAYASDLTSRNRDAPQISPGAWESVRARGAVALTSSRRSTVVRVLVRVAGSPRECAFILAEGTTEPWLGGVLPATHIWLLPLVAVFAAVLLTVAPVMQRIRRLTAAALQSAESEYESGVALSGHDEVAELGRAFDEAARRVRTQLAETRRSEAALREFLANTTHDMMIPLTVLQGHLAELKQRGRKGEPLSGEALGLAMNEAHYLGALIHNLAITAKLDATGTVLQRSQVDLGELVERVVSRHRPIARSLDVSIDQAAPELPVVVCADVTLLEQAVGNLVYNAVRYNRSGGHVAVLVEREGGSGFVIKVIDDGPGIAEEDLARSVERGFRGDYARTRAPDGRGLGLHITQRVAQLHGFRLHFKRSEYGGLQVELFGEDVSAVG